MLKRINILLVITFLFFNCHTVRLAKNRHNSKVIKAYSSVLCNKKLDFDGLTRALMNITEENLHFYPVYKSLMLAFYNANELDEAISYFNSLDNEANPYSSWTLGMIYKKKGMFHKAIEYYKKSIKRDIDFFGSYDELVKIFIEKENKDEIIVLELEEYLTGLKKLKSSHAGPCYGLGLLLHFQSDYKRSLFECYKAIDIDKEFFPALYTIGLNYYKLGDYSKALTYLKKSLHHLREKGDKEGEGSCLNRIGLVYFRTSNYPRALDFFEKSLAVIKETGDKQREAKTLNNIGLINYYMFNFSKALESYEKSLAIIREDGDENREAVILDSIASIYYRIPNYPKAMEYFEKSLAIYNKTGNKYGKADIFHDLGVIHREMHNDHKALDYYEKSLSLYKEIGYKKGEGNILNNIGLIYYYESNFTKALEYMEKSLSIEKELGDQNGIGLSFDNIGAIYTKTSNFSKALEYRNKALTIFKKTGNKKGESRTLLGLGKIYHKTADLSKALEYYEASLSISRENGDLYFEIKSLRQIGSYYFYLKMYESAFSYFQKACELIESIRSGYKNEEFKTSFFEDNIFNYENLVTCLFELHKENPDKEYDQLAFTYIQKSKARGLLDLLTEAKAEINKGIDPELLKRERYLESEYAKYNTELHRLKTQVTVNGGEDLILNLKDKLESLSNQWDELVIQIIRKNPRYAQLKYPEPVSIQEIQKTLLDKNTMLIEYKITDEAVYACRITNEKYYFTRLNINYHDLSNKVDAIMNCLTERMDEEVFISRSAELYSILLKPLLLGLDNYKRILFSPDSILYHLPFETLIKEDNKLSYSQLPYLINEYAIHYTQSATVAYNLVKNKKEPICNKDFIALGDPVFLNEESLPKYGYIRTVLEDNNRAKLNRLVHSGEEVKKISKLFKDSSIFLREDAKEEVIKSPFLEDYRYIHLATHSILNKKNPGFSGLVLTQDDDPVEDGFLLTREIYNLNLNAELVVLSACNTGLGKDVEGEGIIGLTRAWLYAGALSLVVTQWKINDRSTSFFMETFYKYFKTGMSYSLALKETKLKCLQHKIYCHPYYWAGFFLQGGK